jgi:hypothetical protein
MMIEYIFRGIRGIILHEHSFFRKDNPEKFFRRNGKKSGFIGRRRWCWDAGVRAHDKEQDKTFSKL